MKLIETHVLRVEIIDHKNDLQPYRCVDIPYMFEPPGIEEIRAQLREHRDAAPPSAVVHATLTIRYSLQ